MMIFYYRKTNVSDELYKTKTLSHPAKYKKIFQLVYCILSMVFQIYAFATYFYNFCPYRLYEYFDRKSKYGFLLPKPNNVGEKENYRKLSTIKELKNNLYNQDFYNKEKNVKSVTHRMSSYLEYLNNIFYDVKFNCLSFTFHFLSDKTIIIITVILICDILYLIFRLPLFLVLPIILLYFYIRPVIIIIRALKEIIIRVLWVFAFIGNAP